MPNRKEYGPPGSRFLFWVAEVALGLRENAGASRERVADLVGVGSRQIDRFERALNWPRDIDRVAAAYAYVGGLEDPREIYSRALALWYEHGSQPSLDGQSETASEGQRFEEAMRARRASERAPARGAWSER